MAPITSLTDEPAAAGLPKTLKRFLFNRTLVMTDYAKYLESVVGIPVTPFDEHLRVDVGTLEQDLERLVTSGIRTVVPCGNTSEFYSLTPQECREVVTHTCSAAHALTEETCVIAGVGRALETAIEMARHAEAQGCAAVMVHHPPHPFISGVGYYRYVAELTEAVSIGVVSYIRDTSVPSQTILSLAEIENVVGVKYAVNDLQQLRSLIASEPAGANITWVCGTAEAWAPFFFSVGATGFTSGLVNVVPELSLQMLQGLQEENMEAVWRVWSVAKPFEDLRARNQSEHNVSAVKEAMAQQGLGSRRVRAPISELEEADRTKVERILQQMTDLSAPPLTRQEPAGARSTAALTSPSSPE